MKLSDALKLIKIKEKECRKIKKRNTYRRKYIQVEVK